MTQERQRRTQETQGRTQEQEQDKEGRWERETRESLRSEKKENEVNIERTYRRLNTWTTFVNLSYKQLFFMNENSKAW